MNTLVEHAKEHATGYVVVGVLGVLGFLLWTGALAYMNTLHITRIDWIDAEITDVDDEIQRLELYNTFGTEGNKPAREQVILQLEGKRSRLERDKDQLTKE